MFEYLGIKINYKDLNPENEDTLIFLHGWGQNIEMMEPIARPFYKTHRIIIFDLPGFGKSEEPKESWDLSEYVKMIYTFVKDNKIKNPTLIGHSFGGKLSLIYAINHPVKRLILLASPYKVKITKQSLKVRVLKKAKNIPILGNLADTVKKHLGSTDYKNASPRMREILVKHVNTDIENDVSKIKCPTLIIWGTNDEAVPYEDGVNLESLIKNSGLVTYEGCTHYAYLERLTQTNNVLKSFIK